MPTYALSKNGVAAAAGAAYATIHTGASPIKLVKLSFFLTTAVASSIGLIRPNNTPVATTSTSGQLLASSGPASLTMFDTTWSTPPTIVGMEFISGAVLPGAASAGYLDAWRLDRPLELAASSWLVIWNFGSGTGAIPRINFEYDE